MLHYSIDYKNLQLTSRDGNTISTNSRYTAKIERSILALSDRIFNIISSACLYGNFTKNIINVYCGSEGSGTRTTGENRHSPRLCDRLCLFGKPRQTGVTPVTTMATG